MKKSNFSSTFCFQPFLTLNYFQLLYTCLALFRWSDAVRSHSWLGLFGVCLVALTVASGLGCCAFLGFDFNLTTSQIVPFLALGLGVDAVFLMVQTHAEQIVADAIPVEVRNNFLS